jgi:hypothetical protein
LVKFIAEKVKELIVYVESKGGLRAKISKIERLLLKLEFGIIKKPELKLY